MFKLIMIVATVLISDGILIVRVYWWTKYDPWLFVNYSFKGASAAFIVNYVETRTALCFCVAGFTRQKAR